MYGSGRRGRGLLRAWRRPEASSRKSHREDVIAFASLLVASLSPAPHAGLSPRLTEKEGRPPRPNLHGPRPRPNGCNVL